MNATARQIVAALQLAPLPGEGGYFRVTSRTATASAILYLMTPEDFSALHRLGQDETWYFHAGDRVEHVQLDSAAGSPRVSMMGPDVLSGQTPQVFVPAGRWQGARLVAPVARDSAVAGYALLSCTVSPPWDERSFELLPRERALREFPDAAAWVHALTR